VSDLKIGFFPFGRLKVRMTGAHEGYFAVVLRNMRARLKGFML